MRARIYVTAVLTSVLALSACSSIQSARHEYLMRGQVVEVAGDQAVVCVGAQDGAQVGQELKAYKLVSTGTGAPARNPVRWEKVEVGTVRIVQVIDDHFAKAQVVSGPVEVNHVVELAR